MQERRKLLQVQELIAQEPNLMDLFQIKMQMWNYYFLVKYVCMIPTTIAIVHTTKWLNNVILLVMLWTSFLYAIKTASKEIAQGHNQVAFMRTQSIINS